MSIGNAWNRGFEGLHSPCTELKESSDIAAVGFFTRTKLPGGFGGPGGAFLVVVAVVALPLFLLLLKPPQDHQNHQAL